MSVIGRCFLIGGIAVLWLLIVFVRISTRAAVSPREADPIDEAIDAAAELVEPAPTPREQQFALDVECWLASRSYPTPPIVPGKDAA